MTRNSQPGGRHGPRLANGPEHLSTARPVETWGRIGTHIMQLAAVRAEKEVQIGKLHDEVQAIDERILSTLARERNGKARSETLTQRETGVLELLMMGQHNKEIAAALNISVQTAKFHVSNILAKAGVQDRKQLLARGAANVFSEGVREQRGKTTQS